MKYKKWLIILGALPILIILAGIYKFNYLAYKDGYNVDGNKIISGPNVVCDENLNRYKNEAEARKAGLKTEEFGATYCPEYKMDPSWDKNNDGINDCYEGNSCNKNIDYMVPEDTYEKEEKNNEEKADIELVKIKIPTWKFNEEKDDFEAEWKTYEVPKTKAVLNASLKKLFELRSGDKDEKWNGVKFDSVAIRDGVAEVRLSGEWYSAGDMSGMYFRNEIKETVFQYPSVKDLRVYLNDKIFDWCMDDLKDGCVNENGKKYREELWDTTLEEKF